MDKEYAGDTEEMWKALLVLREHLCESLPSFLGNWNGAPYLFPEYVQFVITIEPSHVTCTLQSDVLKNCFVGHVVLAR